MTFTRENVASSSDELRQSVVAVLVVHVAVSGLVADAAMLNDALLRNLGDSEPPNNELEGKKRTKQRNVPGDRAKTNQERATRLTA